MWNTQSIQDRIRLRSRLVRIAGLSCCVSFLFLANAAHADSAAVAQAKEMGQAFADVAKKVSPAVVFVQVEKKVTAGSPAAGSGFPGFFDDDLLRRFFGEAPFSNSPERVVQGQGSGFIVSDDGYILTNNHVVSGADKVKVKLPDDREFDAEMVGTDPHTDVAVIKIDADHLPALRFGDSEEIQVGDWVLALGNPFGLANTLTAGIVSAKGRSGVGITDYEDFIQTDAAINPGNSGGPLVNLDGEVIGMNTAIFSRNGGYAGVGMAIPINMASEIERQLIDNGSVQRGFLGIMIQDLTPDLAASFDVGDTRGILVSEITDGSPADEAGMKRGDIILELDGRPVGRPDQFRNHIALMSPGTKVNLTVLRGGKRVPIAVSIGRREEDEPVASSPASEDELGLRAANLTAELAERFGYVGLSGVVITDVQSGSLADLAGLSSGMLIQEVNRMPVSNLREFKDAINQGTGRDGTLLLVRDKRGSRYILLSG